MGIPLPIVLPGVGDRQASVGLLTLKEFTEKVAPKLNQDEEIYALGLADAAGELFNEEVAEFLRGESVLSSKTVQLLLGTVRSGGLASIDVLNNDTVQSILDQVGSILSSFDGASAYESKLESALSQLSKEERSQLDFIVSELVNRSILRATERLSDVP